MFQLTHKTLFRSLNIINVVKGRFFPKEEQTQYLFNLCTSFEIFAFDESPKSRLHSKLFQHLFSKAFYMCIGPNIDGVDTFFAIRDTDVVHFQYSEAENMFISINYFDLPKNSITPNFASYNDGFLIISCIHGGLCGFEIMKSEAQLSFSIKPCTSVLQSFPVYKNCFFRIETGPNLAFYHIKPFGLEYKRKYDEPISKRIFYAFPFGQDGIVFCTETDLKCVTTNSDSIITFPQKLQFDPIINHSPIAPSDVLILTRKGSILRLRSDLSLTLICRPEENSKILKIFNLDTNHFLVVNKASDHHVNYLSDKDDCKIMQIISSAVGLSNISICTPRILNEGPCIYAPQIFSHSDDTLIICRQGINLTLLNEFELPDKPTGLFNLTYEGKEYIVVSFENGSKLLEITKDADTKRSTIQVSKLDFAEEGKTLGVVTNGTTPEQEKSFQILPDRVAPIPFTSKKYIKNSYQEKTTLVAFTKHLNIRITEKNMLCLTGKFKRSGTNEIVDRFFVYYELKFIATYITASPPDADGFAEFVVMGAHFPETKEYSVVFQNISDDDPEREYVINEKYPSKICSIEFLDKLPNRQIGILIGLESGSLIVGEVNFEKREIETKQILQLGVSPCHIRVFRKYKTLIFGLSTRIWILEPVFGKNLIKAHPFSVASPNFMTMDSDYHLFLISGKTFSIYVLNQRPINPDYTIYRQKFPNQIISVKIIDTLKPITPGKYQKVLTPILLIVCKREIFAYDSTYPIINPSIVSLENEIITGASYTNKTTYSKWAAALKEYTYNSYLAISTICTTTLPNREYMFHCIKVYKVENQMVKTLSTRSSEQKKNLPLLRPILSEQLAYRIDAISITSCPFSMMGKYDKKDFFIAIASFNLIFLYSFDNQKLSLLTKIKHNGSKINHLLICLENHSKTVILPFISIYVSDVQKSVSMIYYNILQNMVIPFSEEGALRPISSELSPYRIDKMFFCGGDRLGNFFIFSQKSQFTILSTKSTAIRKSDSTSDEKSNTSSKSKLIENQKELHKPVQRLWFFYNINVGDVITSVDPAIEFDQVTPYPIWYSTVGGSIGCFLESTSFKKTYALLNSLEIEIAALIFQLTHCDSLTFRNKYYQSYPICDLDVVDIFTKLTPQRKEYIIKKLLEKNIAKELGLQPSNILDVLESEILKCSNFFWLWN